MNRQKLHYIHIGKTGGTQIDRYIQKLNNFQDKFVLTTQPHVVKLKDLPLGDQYFFSIRNPITRFRSGFYSRLRKGLPRYHVEWDLNEKIAFNEFKTANDLAESIFEGGLIGHRAFSAMLSIGHVNNNQVEWFYNFGNFLNITPPFFIIRQENFNEDINQFQLKLGIQSPILLDTDLIKSHVNNYPEDSNLSKKAVVNLERWYSQDFVFYKLCLSVIEKYNSA
jgi:hypothetical protein